MNINQEGSSDSFFSDTSEISPEYAALDALPNVVEHSAIQIENCFVVFPDRDTLDFELVLADPGEAGLQAIGERFDRLKWAMDLEQVADTITMARQLSMFTTKPYWSKTPRHYLFIAIKEETPVAKFVVQATDIRKAIAKASKAAPGCYLNIVALLEQLESAGDAFLSMLNGGLNITTLDLRTP